MTRLDWTRSRSGEHESSVRGFGGFRATYGSRAATPDSGAIPTDVMEAEIDQFVQLQPSLHITPLSPLLVGSPDDAPHLKAVNA